MMKMDLALIKKILKHREPFLFVDAIEDISADAITASLKVSKENVFLKGHFPGDPVVPGIFLIEAMAQAAAFLAIYNLRKEQGGGLKNVEYDLFLSKVNSVKFKAKIIPPVTLRIKAKINPTQIENFYEAIGQVYVGEELKAVGSQVLYFKIKE